MTRAGWWISTALGILIGAQSASAQSPQGVSPAPAAASQPATQGLDAPGWKVFADRVGTTVDYPSGIFTVDGGEAPRGNGRELRSADGRARFMVYVEDNPAHYTPSRFIRTQLAAARSDLDYRRVADRFFAISGLAGDQVYYSRCNFPSGRGKAIHCIYVAYPKAEQRMWDDIVTRISLSLRPKR